MIATIPSVLLGALFLLTSLAVAAQPAPVIYSKQGQFEEVRDALGEALTNRGLVVSYHARIGEMLARTGKDIGADRVVYRHAEAFEFCSAALSRALMEADPTAIAYCPFTVFVYELPASPGKIHVGYRPPPTDNAIAKPGRAIRQLLDELAREAVK